MNVTCNTFWVRKVAFQNTFPHSSPAIFVIKSSLHSLTRVSVIPHISNISTIACFRSTTWIKVDARGGGVQSEFWNLLTFDFGKKKKKDGIPLPYTSTLSYNDDTSIKEDLSTYVDVDVYAHKLSFTSQLGWNDVGIDWLIDWVWLFYVF